MMPSAGAAGLAATLARKVTRSHSSQVSSITLADRKVGLDSTPTTR
jgi:hypothetical protein